MSALYALLQVCTFAVQERRRARAGQGVGRQELQQALFMTECRIAQPHAHARAPWEGGSVSGWATGAPPPRGPPQVLPCEK